MVDPVGQAASRAADVGEATATLEEIDIRAEFLSRPRRQADTEAEDRALVQLAKEMAENPPNMLQKLVETAVQLCSAGTAGISLLEGDVFRWEAVAGVFASYRNGTMPRAASPCGVCIDRDSTQIMHLADRCFPALRAAPRFVEALLIPFHVQSKPVGTVWIVAHNDERKFDISDERIVSVLSQFAEAGWQLWKARESAEEASRRKDEFLARLGHEPRNPLASVATATQSFSTRQTARILGVAEATVKRLTDDGKLHCLTSSARGMRKFVPEQIVRYLRGNENARDAAQAIAKADLPGALGAMIEKVTAGMRLEALLDELTPPLRTAPATFAAALLARASALAPEPQRPPGTALVAPVGRIEAFDVRLVACVLGSHGYDVLQPTPGTTASELIALADRVRPEFSVLVSADAAGDAEAVAAAAQLASRRRDGTVCVSTRRSPTVPQSATVVQSMTALGNLLRGE